MYCYVVLSSQVICNCGILSLVHFCNYAPDHGSSLLAMLYISYAMLQCSNIQLIKLSVIIMLMRKLVYQVGMITMYSISLLEIVLYKCNDQ